MGKIVRQVWAENYSNLLTQTWLTAITGLCCTYFLTSSYFSLFPSRPPVTALFSSSFLVHSLSPAPCPFPFTPLSLPPSPRWISYSLLSSLPAGFSASHLDEVDFLFGVPLDPRRASRFSREDKDVALAFINYVANFIRSGSVVNIFTCLLLTQKHTVDRDKIID